MPGAGSSTPLVKPIFGLVFLTSFIAGCTSAPSWPTVAECNASPNESWEGCAEPSKIAQDFKTLLESTVNNGEKLSDASALRRLNPSESRPAYLLGPLDELSVTVWGAREIWSEITDLSHQPTRVTSIQDNGTIVLPLLPNTHIANLTLSDALAKIAEQYRKVIGTTFQVDGLVTRFRSKPVQLDGAFIKPGTVYLSNEIRTLGDAISIGGGGFPEVAELAKGVLIRGPQRFRIDFSGAQKGENDVNNIELAPGDRVFFPSRETGFFHVLGEVQQQGTFAIPEKGITLIQGIALAKGPIQNTANMNSIFLVRISGEKPRIYRLTLTELMANLDVSIAPGDRIFVSSRGVTDWNRTITQAVPGNIIP